MGTDTAAKPRAGFLHRLHCARDGHYWERQLSDDGGQARWVCIRCGKQGETVPLVSAVTPVDEVVAAPAEPAQAEGDTGVMPRVAQNDTHEVVRDVVDDPEPELEPEPEPEPVMSSTEPVSEPEWEPAAEPITQAAPEPEPSAASTGASFVAMAAVSLVIVGGVYLAFRRRRR